MHAGAEQRLIHVDVSKTRCKSLIEQKRLDRATALQQSSRKFLRVHGKNIRTDHRRRVGPRQPAEFPDVVIKNGKSFERQNLSGVRPRRAVNPEQASHAEAGDETHRGKFKDDSFAMPPNAKEGSVAGKTSTG